MSTVATSEPTSPPKPPADPTPGSIVRVVTGFGAGTNRYAYAFVLGVSPKVDGTLGTNGEPSLTVAFPDPRMAGSLGTINWHLGFRRTAAVPHISHPDAKAGRTGIYWVDTVPDPNSWSDSHSFPVIPQGESTVLSREMAESFFEQPAKTVPQKIEPLAIEEPLKKTLEEASKPGPGNEGAENAAPAPTGPPVVIVGGEPAPSVQAEEKNNTSDVSKAEGTE